jgi:hypothetical protein
MQISGPFLQPHSPGYHHDTANSIRSIPSTNPINLLKSRRVLAPAKVKPEAMDDISDNIFAALDLRDYALQLRTTVSERRCFTTGDGRRFGLDAQADGTR